MWPKAISPRQWLLSHEGRGDRAPPAGGVFNVMAAFPLLGGMAANGQAEFIENPPLNLEPIMLDNKIAAGQFRASAGVETVATGPGADRGAIVYKGQHYRVMGTSLVLVSGGVVTTLGDVGGSGPVSLDYGFDRLIIRSGDKLFYYTDAGLAQVTDVDLGPVLDALWVDGYTMTTDGTSLVVTELANNTSVEPLKYGSAEEDPDMVTGLAKVRGEVLVLGRYTIEYLQNVGGNGFPFQVIDNATIPFGCVSASAKTLFLESLAFVGSGRNEALGVYLSGSGTASKISSRALDRELAKLPDPSVIELEVRTYLDEQRLFVHLPNQTWVYYHDASQRAQMLLWGKVNNIVRHAVEFNGEFYVGGGNLVGKLVHNSGAVFGQLQEWAFTTGFLYNEGRGYIIKSVELVGLPGRGGNARIYLSISRDGETYSQERVIDAGRAGQRLKRLQWRPMTHIPNYCILKFRGTDLSGFTKLELDLEGLAR